jgi:hypothetical protein
MNIKVRSINMEEDMRDDTRPLRFLDAQKCEVDSTHLQ